MEMGDEKRFYFNELLDFTLESQQPAFDRLRHEV